MKEQEKNLKKKTANEIKLNNLQDKECKVVVIRILNKLGKEEKNTVRT